MSTQENTAGTLKDDHVVPSHRCTICGALWRHWSERDTGRADSWSLRSDKSGPCCDAAPMGAQIVPLTLGELRDALTAQAPEFTVDPARLEPAAHGLARRCLWIAYVWNDHNFDACHTYARQEARKHGINSFEQAGRWLEALGGAR